MVAAGLQNLLIAWWYPFFSGLAIATAVLAFSLLGDALQDWLIRRRAIANPKEETHGCRDGRTRDADATQSDPARRIHRRLLHVQRRGAEDTHPPPFQKSGRNGRPSARGYSQPWTTTSSWSENLAPLTSPGTSFRGRPARNCRRDDPTDPRDGGRRSHGRICPLRSPRGATVLPARECVGDRTVATRTGQESRAGPLRLSQAYRFGLSGHASGRTRDPIAAGLSGSAKPRPIAWA